MRLIPALILSVVCFLLFGSAASAQCGDGNGRRLFAPVRNTVQRVQERRADRLSLTTSQTVTRTATSSYTLKQSGCANGQCPVPMKMAAPVPKLAAPPKDKQ